MANDIFGYDKSKTMSATSLLPPGSIKVTIGGEIKLAQTVDINYQREISPTYELGSENVYLVTGKSSGTMNVSRLIGSVFENYLPKEPCAVQSITVTKSSKGVCGDGNVSLTMSGMLQSVTFSANAGALTVTDGASYTLISLSKS